MNLGKMGSRGGFGSLGVLGRSGTTYDAAAQAIFNAFTTPPTAARKALINTCVLALKSAGIWSQLDTLYLTAAADSQAATINWVSPSSFTLVPVNSPTFQADRGFTGNGTTSRLRTQYTPSVNAVNYTQNSASIWAWPLTDIGENAQDIGNQSSPIAQLASKLATFNTTFRVNDATGLTNVPNSSSIGFFGGSRASSTTRKLWLNGAQIGSDQTATSNGVPAQEQWICGANSASFSTKQIAAAAWGASLTGLESAFYNALLAYLHGVGAA